MSNSCDPTNCSLPGSSIHGILHARILEWVAISFSRGISWPRNCSTQNHKSVQILLTHGPEQLRTPTQALDGDWNFSQTECQVCDGICDPENFTHLPTVVTEVYSSIQYFSCIARGTPYIVSLIVHLTPQLQPKCYKGSKYVHLIHC